MSTPLFFDVLSVHFLDLWFFVSGFLKLVLIGLGLNISGFYNSFDSISNRENDRNPSQDFTKNASQYVTKRLEITRTVEHHYTGSERYREHMFRVRALIVAFC